MDVQLLHQLLRDILKVDRFDSRRALRPMVKGVRPHRHQVQQVVRVAEESTAREGSRGPLPV